MMSKKTSETFWWKNGVFYHIYPQSFMDTNGDGIGDINGIVQKLDYLCSLGIDAIWLSPIYPSPMIDSGYDISDYKDINPIYGEMSDFKELLSQAHSKGLKIIIDLVLNHTSDQHPWFIESRSAKDNPQRDWYIWEAPKAGKKPNNWMTNFGQSAWTYDAITKEYYYHSFFKEQPDLNWRNPDLRKAMFEIVRFWLDLGFDGFRLDVINMLFKDKHLRKNPINFLFGRKKVYNRNRPSVYEMLSEFRKILDTYPDKTSIGEIYTPPPGDPYLTAKFLGNGKDMLHMAFDFSLFFSRWNAGNYYEIINNYYDALPDKGWACFVLSNHDLGRCIDRGIFKTHKREKAKILAMLQLTLKGTPFIYYGDEIGMENVNIPKKQIHDMYGKLFYPFYKGRDAYRTPMQWNSQIYGGFSDQQPWLPLHKNYKNVNVEQESKAQESILSLYKKLLQMRKHYTVLQSGDFRFLDVSNTNILAYSRFSDTESIIILLNFTNKAQRFSGLDLNGYSNILSISSDKKKSDLDSYSLGAFDGVAIYKKLQEKG